MASNLSKKFALLCCCLMTMQALRLIISTAGFCAVRFHIDCSLFNIFISRLVNAVMMSSLIGNWLGDLFVFGFNGRWKIISATAAIWIEFLCFCTALFSICHTECGHLTGFYWSMVMAYFWWKVSEAPIVSIAAPDAVDYYYAGFTLSGVWAAFLKGMVMRCVAGGGKQLRFNSDVFGDVNVNVVGVRSVKTTLDYRAAKWLYIITIVLTFFMCFVWLFAAALVGGWEKTGQTGTIAQLGSVSLEDVTVKGEGQPIHLQTASGKVTPKVNDETIEIKLTNVQKNLTNWNAKTDLEQMSNDNSTKVKDKIAEDVKATLKLKDPSNKALAKAVDEGFVNVMGSDTAGELTITLTAPGMIVGESENMAAGALAGIAFGGVLAVSGAMLGAGVGWVFAKCFKCCVSAAAYVKLTKRCQLIFGIFGAGVGMAAGFTPCLTDTALTETDGKKAQEWVKWFKWPQTNANKPWWVNWAPMLGLGVGLVTGALVGSYAVKNRDDWSGFAAGAFFGSFLGLISGEIYNGAETWAGTTGFNVKADGGAKGKEKEVVSCGFFIVVCGLGTVYSIYPGMAPCSITQFQYFNIIDILILILSSIGPLVIMGADLANGNWKLGNVITGSGGKDKNTNQALLWSAIGAAVLMTLATNVCEILVICVMQHPFSKLAQRVTTIGWQACLITIMMVSFQLTSTGIGFACVAAGGGFNDGVNNVLSTLTLWTIECTGVLGEGYLTELKKYEAGKWPTQGMGRCASYWWWNGKAFGNAWQIWCCIGTTDLRRDIMLCKQ